MKKLIPILVLSLCLTARAEEEFKLLSVDDQPRPKLGLSECALGIGALAAGAAVYIWLRHYCQKYLGTNAPATNNLPKVERSDNLNNWGVVGTMAWTTNGYCEYRETNASHTAFFYRVAKPVN